MQTLYVVVASASGLALGYATAAHFAAGARKSLQAKLKDETSALKEAQAKVKELKSGDKGGDSKKSSKGKSNKKGSDKDLKKAEKQVADANKEIERLKDAQMASNKSHSDALDKIKTELEEAKESKDQAVAEAVEAAEQARPAAESSEPTVNGELVAALGSAGASLEAILATLIDHEGQKGALLGDMNGIIIAQSGDTDTVESTAAASNTLITLPQKLDGMLPMNKHFGYRLADGENSISGCTFETEGELMALTTVGGSAPDQASMDAVIESLNAALG